LRAARDLGLRSLAFTGAFLLAAAVAARMGDAQVAAHTIGFQLWIFVALVLDSVAIAAQALIGRLLGAGAVDAAAALARRLLVAGSSSAWRSARSSRPAITSCRSCSAQTPRYGRQAAVLWPWLVGMMPIAGALFALDGVFFGAGDLAFLRRMTLIAALGAFLPLLVAAHVFDHRPGRRVGRNRRIHRRSHALGRAALALAPLARGGHLDGRRNHLRGLSRTFGGFSGTHGRECQLRLAGIAGACL